MKPEEKARQKIDQILRDAGWDVQDHKDLNLGASLGVAVREFPVETGYAEFFFPEHLHFQTYPAFLCEDINPSEGETVHDKGTRTRAN